MTERFIFAPLEIIADDRLNKTQLRVLLALFSFRGRSTNTVHPRRAALAQRTGYDLSVLSRTTRQLVELGWLTKEGKGGHGRATRYTLTVPETVTKVVTVESEGTVTKVVTVNSDQGGQGRSDQGGQGRSDQGGHTQRTDHKNRPLEQKRESARPAGTRMTLTELPCDWRAFCNTERPGLDADRTFQIFRDHWIAKAGRDGLKADWEATWRNWVRREHGAARDPGTPTTAFQRAQEAYLREYPDDRPRRKTALQRAEEDYRRDYPNDGDIPY